MDGQRIFPGELALLTAFVFAPPLLAAFVVEWILLTARSVKGTWRRIATVFGLTLVGSMLFGLGVAILAPPNWGPVLGLREVRLGDTWLPVAPLAFISVAFVAPLATLIGMVRVLSARGHS